MGGSLWTKVSWKAAIELCSSLLMAAAAVYVLLTVAQMRPHASQANDVTGLRLDASEITHVEGHGDVAIVEFSDFECPFCRQYATTVFPQVEKDVVDSGKARYVAFNFPLDNIHPLARKAAVAVNCAGRAGRYWEMHARLFEISPNLTLPQLVAQGAALGLEPRAWGQCLQDSRGTRVDKDLAVGHRLGVTGTPTFFVGVVDTGGGISLKKRMVGAATPKVLAQVVADVREGTSLIARLEHLVGFTP